MSGANIVKTLLSETVYNCLWDPGYFFPAMSKTGNITHDAPIEQLFANFYKKEHYKFITKTPNEVSLNKIEQYFVEHQAEYKTHIEVHHITCLSELRYTGDCKENCIFNIIQIVNECIQNYASEIYTNESSSDNNLIEAIFSTYNSYINFIVVLEDKLPSLSRLIEMVPSTGYPFSLWKYLYRQYLKYILEPKKDQLEEEFIEVIGRTRKDIIDIELANHKHNGKLSIIYDQICQLYQISSILASEMINEKSVYYLKSSENCYYANTEQIEKKIAVQTKELYDGYNIQGVVCERILNSDLGLLKRILVPNCAKKLLKNCISIAEEIWNFNDIPLKDILESFNDKDNEIDICFKKLSATN